MAAIRGVWGMADIEARLLAAAEEANERIRTCHERVSCPTCWAPVGVRCRAMPAGFVVGPRGGGSGRELKNSHAARSRLVQPDR